MTFDFLAVRNRTAPTSSLYPDLGALPGHVESEPADGMRVPVPVERIVVQRYDGAVWNDVADLDAPGRIGVSLTDTRMFAVSEAVDALVPSAVSVPVEAQVVAQCRHEWVARLEYAQPDTAGGSAIVGAQAFDGTTFELDAIRFLLYLAPGTDPTVLAMQWLDRIIRQRLAQPGLVPAVAAELRQPRTFHQLPGGATMLVEIPAAEEALDVAAGASPDPTAALRPAPLASLPPPPAQTSTHTSVFDGTPAAPPAPAGGPAPLRPPPGQASVAHPPVGPPPTRRARRAVPVGTVVAIVVGVLVLAAAVTGVVLALSGDDGDQTATDDSGPGDDGGTDGGGTDDGTDGATDGGDTDGADGTTDGGGTDGADGGSDLDALLVLANERVQPATVSIEMMGCRRGGAATGVLVGPDLVVTSAVNAQLSWAVRVLLPGQDEPVIGRPTGADGRLLLLRLDGGTGSAVGLAEGLPAVGDPVVAVGRTSSGAGLVLPVPSRVTSAGDSLQITLDSPIDATMLGAPVLGAGPVLVGVISGLDGTSATVTPLGALPPEGGPPPLADCGDTAAGFAPADDVSYQTGAIEALILAQRLASALADADWDLVRALEPGKAGFTDQQFQNGWGTLDRSTVVPVRTINSGNPFRFRVGLVAHETDGGQPVTRLFCVTWVADIDTGTVIQTGENSVQLTTPQPLPGHVDPAGQVVRLRDNC